MSYANTHYLLDLRALVSDFGNEKLDDCLQQQIANGYNSCYASADNLRAVNVLAKASFIKGLMLQGMPVQQAMRELGKRMRALESQTGNARDG